jgi:hydrogenase maturation protein HypF
MKLATYSLLVSGLVQGIGFRPFIYRLALENRLSGSVENRNDGVAIQVNGTREMIESFSAQIREKAPPACSIRSIAIKEINYTPFDSFRISPSENVSGRVTEISPDIAVCEECLSDLEHQAHRISYPLINCTHCGPRFSILRDLPYDRPQTTMAGFQMCELCQSEYENVNDRRFHAQPVACNQCGPFYTLESEGETYDQITRVLKETARLLSRGALLAMKGTGGYHLVCDAFNGKGIRKLREVKKRNGKPFAVMFSSVEHAREWVWISKLEEELLLSWRRPIVLLTRKREFTLGVADGLSTLGVMLPYMPFHHLLFRELDTPVLVMTSGNFSEEPILISDDAVNNQFEGFVDGVVSYNREIYNRVDDSVAAVIGNIPMVLRRARGYTPTPIRTRFALEGILGTGAELTGSFCLGKEHMAIMSQYTGDLKNLETYEFYRESFERFSRMFRFTPRLVVSDLHPDYLSTRFACGLAEELQIPHLQVQHHHAHVASGMLSAGLEGEVIGFSFDGTGLGSDGKGWGGEVLKAGYLDFDRLYHFDYVPLPGGDRAVKEPWRMGVSYLFQVYGMDLLYLRTPLNRAFSNEQLMQMMVLLEKEINSPAVSSAGRLFDAVAAITGLNYYSTYQAEAPMLLESVLDPDEKGSYPVEIREGRISFNSLVSQLVHDIHHGVSVGRVAARFHRSLLDLIVDLARQIREIHGLEQVVLAGGTFQNRFLTQKVIHKLEIDGFRVYLPDHIPVNDQGIAAGQVAIGAHQLK